MPSTFITWIFAKSINNSATLGGRFGLLGGIAYAGPSCRVMAPESWLYQEERAWGHDAWRLGWVGVTTPSTCRTKLSTHTHQPPTPLLACQERSCHAARQTDQVAPHRPPPAARLVRVLLRRRLRRVPAAVRAKPPHPSRIPPRAPPLARPFARLRATHPCSTREGQPVRAAAAPATASAPSPLRSSAATARSPCSASAWPCSIACGTRRRPL